MLQYKYSENSSFSVRSWSKKMGFKSHTSLVNFLNNDRKIKPQHVDFLLKGLKIKNDSENYFKALVHFNSAKTNLEKEFYISKLKTLHPNHELSFVELDQFKTIADWHHMAILEMINLKNFKNDYEWISKRLGNKVSKHQVQDAIKRMLHLGLISEANGQLTKTNKSLMTPKGKTNECIKEHHKQVIELAAQAVEEQSLNERYFNSCTMTIDASLINVATELIIEFRRKLAKVMEKNQGDETYQLTVQFFRLTEELENRGETNGQ